MTELGTYPRIYQFGPWRKLVWLALGSLFLAAGIACMIFAQKIAPVAPYVVTICGLIPIAIGLAAAISTLRGRLTLYPDRLEYRLLGTRIVRVADIRETRRPVHQFGQFNITLDLKGAKRKSIRITDFGQMDDPLTEWLEALPNAELRVENDRQERLLANPAFGRDPANREHRINADAKYLTWLSWAGYALAAWGWFHPVPYDICLYVLMAVPPAAAVLAVVSNGRWSLGENPASGRLSLVQIWFAPAGVLVLRTLIDVDFVDWNPVVAVTFATGVVLTLMVAAIERGLKPWHAVLTLCVTWAYVWGAMAEANVLLDRAPPRTFETRVISKHVSSGKITTYDLELTPWGPITSSRDDYTVSESLYKRVVTAETVCVYLYPGRLGWQHYVIDTCLKMPK